MSVRGQGSVILVVAVIVVAAAVFLDRLGLREPNAAESATTTSATWLCPHGGGRGFEGAVFLANPGDSEVTARVTELDAADAAGLRKVVVPPGSEVEVGVAATARSSSTYVETFGGWIAAGWVIRGAGGAGAEPCASEARRSWVSAGATTGRGNDAFLIVMNPFDTDAVFDVALFSSRAAPVRDSELTDVTVSPHRSSAIRLNTYAQGEDGLGISIHVSSGRVAASTLVVTRDRGISGVLASAETTDRQVMLTASGVGRSVLAVAVPTAIDAPNDQTASADATDQPIGPPAGQVGSSFAATLRSRDPPQPAGGLADQSQEPESAAVYPIDVNGPSAVDLVVNDGTPVVAALRTTGGGRDDGATAGSTAPSSAWVVTPTVAGEPSRPGLLLLNPGEASASVTLSSLPLEGGATAETSMTVAPGSVGVAPSEFLVDVGSSAILVTAQGSPVVALGASTSLGNDGLSLFGLAAGLPMPDKTP